MGWGQPEAWGNVFVAWGRALIASAFTSERTRQKCEWASRGAGSRRAACFFGQIFTWEKKALLLNLESWGFDPRGISDLGADLGRDCRWGGAHGCSHPSARGGPAAPAPPLRRLLRRSARLTLLQAHCVLPWPPFLCTRCRCPLGHLAPLIVHCPPLPLPPHLSGRQIVSPPPL